MRKFASLLPEERKEVFQAVSVKKGLRPEIIEKDFWVMSFYYSYYRWRECKALVSEQAINKTCEEDLTKRLQDHQYMLDLSKVKEKYEDLAYILDSIPRDVLRYDTDLTYLTSLYCRKEEDKTRLDYCLRTLSAGIKHSSFLNLPYTEKRDFLKENVEDIIYNKKSKEINVHYLINWLMALEVLCNYLHKIGTNRFNAGIAKV